MSEGARTEWVIEDVGAHLARNKANRKTGRAAEFVVSADMKPGDGQVNALLEEHLRVDRMIVEQERARPDFEFLTLAELRARVRERGPRTWLLRGIWPSGAYGSHAAEMKTQKSWNAVDAAVSVSSGTEWLGHVPVDDPGPVLIFWGEGDDAGLVRRIDAVCESRGLDPDELPITVCCRVPHLGSEDHLAKLERQVDELRPRLTILDPLYLAARGAKSSDIYAMGEYLELVQRICTAAGSALLLVTHFNRRDGSGPLRISGAGPAEWGRVLILGTVKSRRTDTETKATTVITSLDIVGGDIPDQALRVTRTIQADDPDDLDSPLRYEVETEEGDVAADGERKDDMPPARRKLLEALLAANSPREVSELVDWVADKYGHGLRRETASRELNALRRDGLADEIDDGKGGWTASGGAYTGEDQKAQIAGFPRRPKRGRQIGGT